MSEKQQKKNSNVLYPLIINNKSKDKEQDKNNLSKNKNAAKPKRRNPNLIGKKSNSLNYITNPNDISKSKTIEILNSINCTQNNKYSNINITNNNSNAYDLFSKHRPIDSESLQMKNRQLKNEINQIKKKLSNINSENSKKDEVILKHESLIDQLLNINKQAYLKTMPSFENSSQNFYNNNLIGKISKQYLDLKNENNNKDIEIKELKKNIKNSQNNELTIENNILVHQYKKYQNLLQHLLDENKKYSKKMKNQNEIENEILQKNFEILQLQENLKLSNTMNIQYEKEAEELKKKIKEYEEKNKNIKNSIKKINMEFNKILLEKKEVEDNFFNAYNEINKYEYNYNNINRINNDKNNISEYSEINTNNYSENIYNKTNNVNNSNINDNLNNSNTFDETNNLNTKFNDAKNEFSEKTDIELSNNNNNKLNNIEIKNYQNDNDINNLNNNKFNTCNLNDIDNIAINLNNNNNTINTNSINNEESIKIQKKDNRANDNNNIQTIDEENIITNIESETNYRNNNIQSVNQNNNNNKEDNFPIEYNSENISNREKEPTSRNLQNTDEINRTNKKTKFSESYIDENYNNENNDIENNNNIREESNDFLQNINEENKNDDGNNINESDNVFYKTHNTNVIMNDFDVKLATYILIKNFEACEITRDTALTLIIKPILTEIGNNKQIEKNYLINLFSNKICESIGVKIQKDFEEIEKIVILLLNESNNDLSNFIDNFLKLFDTVKKYSECGKEEEYIRQINIELSEYKEYFKTSYDKNIIPFTIFRDILNNKNIQLENDIIEYLIYRMKKDCRNINIDIINEVNNNNNDDEQKKNISIFDLCFQTLLNLIL